MSNTVVTEDGSKTLYSSKYKQNFHDTKTGALQEALTKHIIPAFDFHKESKNLRVLDICFGIGYNTLATIYYILKSDLDINVSIFSPELDGDLVKSLASFEYPKEFENLKEIIKELSLNHKYEDERFRIELFIGDAREYIKSLKDIDIVYQDAFSSDVNRELWSVEYFNGIFNACSDNAIVTTYSVATPVRLSMFEAGFEIYEIKPVKKKQTIAFKSKQNIDAKYIDMNQKKEKNKEAKAIYD